MARDMVPVLKRCRSLDIDPAYLGYDKKSKRQAKRSNRKKGIVHGKESKTTRREKKHRHLDAHARVDGAHHHRMRDLDRQHAKQYRGKEKGEGHPQGQHRE